MTEPRSKRGSGRSASAQDHADSELSDQGFRAVLDALPAAVYTTDAEGRVQYFNAAVVELTGRIPQPGSDRWCVSWKLYRCDGTPLARADCPMAVALREGQAIRGAEVIIERPDGSRVACMPYPTPLLDANGRVVGGINLLVDVSDRRRAESELRESELRFSRFMEHLPGLAWIKDRSGGYVYANDAAQLAFGKSLAQLVGRTDNEVFPPETAAEFAANDRQVLERDQGIQTIETLVHGDGSVHFSLVSKFPISAGDGLTTMIGGVAIDITGLKETEVALRRSEAWFRTLAEASPALIWRLDPDGRLAYVNPRCREYFGLPDDAVLDHGWRVLLHPADAAGFLDAVSAAQRDHVRLQFVTRVADRHGAWRWIDTYALPLFGEDAEYLGHIGTSLDITEHKLAEAALSDADRRKDQFLAILAHELRGPLAPMRSSIEILNRIGAAAQYSRPVAGVAGSMPDPSTSMAALAGVVGILERQVNQLVRLVDDLLDVSRISRGRIELRRETLDMRSIAEHAAEAVRPLCQARGQALEVELPGGAVWVDADPARLAQVLGNLLSNASKYTDRGGRIGLALETSPESQPGTAVIRVRDDGIGIETGQMSRIFELFTQVDTSLERVGGGLGIGLTLAKTLVGMHGGSIEVHSDGIDQGSEFVVRLPLVAAAARPTQPAGAASESTVTIQRRILVVDDNRDSADSLASLLRMGGHEVLAAYDGLEAIEADSAFRPELILLDIGMPGLNGLETARRIRRGHANGGPLIVALTGWGQQSDRQASKDAGFDAHLVKPVDDATLARLLAQLTPR